MLDLLTFEWFLPRALIGLAIGYFLRMLEHLVWGIETGQVKSFKSFFLYGIMVLTQSLTLGLPLAYVFIWLIAKSTPNETIINVTTYLIPVLTGFIAVDFRELVRRITRA